VDASGVYFKKLSGNIVRVNIFEVCVIIEWGGQY
jgi:hypothetical protein